jgi:hypothetical protein
MNPTTPQEIADLCAKALSSYKPLPEPPKILQNAAYIPSEGVYLKSTYDHDYQWHKWVEGGVEHELGIDGGKSYIRRVMSTGVVYEDWSLYEGDPFPVIAEKFLWKTFGPLGDQPGRWVPLSQCDTDHLEAILKTQLHIKNNIIEKIVKYLLTQRGKAGKLNPSKKVKKAKKS